MTARPVPAMALAAAATAVTAAALCRWPPGGESLWRRTNHRGEPVTLLEGPALVLGATGGLLAAPGVPARVRAGGSLALLAAGVLGAYDDLAGDAGRKGLAGHLGALTRGELTTGAVKLLGLAATGTLAAAVTTGADRAGPLGGAGARVVDALVGGAVVAGSANLLNLLDLRPGRALKVVLLTGPWLLMDASTGTASAVLGSAAVLLPADLRERSMLGDCGANAAGAVLGVAAVSRLGRPGRAAAFAVLVVLTVTSERVSFTRVIEATPGLRELDRLGRRPAPRPTPSRARSRARYRARRRAVTATRAVRGIASAAAAVAVVTLLARIVGFGRWLVFEGSVGSGWVGTAYAGANVVPNVLFEVVAGGALAASVVPVLASSVVRGNDAETARTASALLTWTVLILTPVALVLALLAHPVARLLVGSGAPAPVAESAGRMLVAFAPQVVLYGVGVVLTGVLQAHHRFLGPALAPLLSSVVVVGVYLTFAATTGSSDQPVDWLPGRAGEALLAWGTTAGVLALSLPLLIPVRRARLRLRPTLRLDAEALRRVRVLAAAGLAGLVAQQCLVLVTARLATSGGGVGTLNVYQYTQAVYLLPYAVLAVPLATATFPALAGHAASVDGERYAAVLARSTRTVVLVALAGVAVLVAVAPAVGGVFTELRGGSPALRAMPLALTAYAPGLVGFALLAHLGRALFAADAVRWAARSTVAGWGTAVVLSVVLVPALTGPDPDPGRTLLALGIASSVGMTVAGALLVVGTARLRVGAVQASEGLHGWAPVLLRSAAVGVVALVVGRLGTDLVLGSGGMAEAVAAGLVGALITAAVLGAGLAVAARDDLRGLRSVGWRR